MSFWRAGAGQVRVAVKVQPKSRRPGLAGLVADIEGQRLRIGVADAPEDGRANRAVCALLAAALDLPAATIRIAQGHTSRQKTVLIEGDPATITQRLQALCPPP